MNEVNKTLSKESSSWDKYYNESGLPVICSKQDIDYLYRGPEYPNVNLEAYEALKKLKLLNKQSKFLEIGCGNSDIGLRVGVNEKYKKTALIDFSSKIKEFIEGVISIAKVKNVLFYRDDALKYRLDEKFDVIYSAGLLDHFDNDADVNRVILNNIRHLKVEGYYVSIEPIDSTFNRIMTQTKNVPENNIIIRFFHENEIKDFFINNGLAIVYHQKVAISIRPHVIKNAINDISMVTLLCLLPKLIIYYINLTLYRMLFGNKLKSLRDKNPVTRLLFKPLYVAWKLVRYIFRKYGKISGDYVITIGKKDGK